MPVSVLTDPRGNVRPSNFGHRLIPVDPQVHQLRVTGNRRQQDSGNHSRNRNLVRDDVLTKVGDSRFDEKYQQDEMPDRSAIHPE